MEVQGSFAEALQGKPHLGSSVLPLTQEEVGPRLKKCESDESNLPKGSELNSASGLRSLREYLTCNLKT